MVKLYPGLMEDVRLTTGKVVTNPGVPLSRMPGAGGLPSSPILDIPVGRGGKKRRTVMRRGVKVRVKERREVFMSTEERAQTTAEFVAAVQKAAGAPFIQVAVLAGAAGEKARKMAKGAGLPAGFKAKAAEKLGRTGAMVAPGASES